MSQRLSQTVSPPYADSEVSIDWSVTAGPVVIGHVIDHDATRLWQCDSGWSSRSLVGPSAVRA